ncbi:hypothetical protein ABK040_005167 [Willaertia magna]
MKKLLSHQQLVKSGSHKKIQKLSQNYFYHHTLSSKPIINPKNKTINNSTTKSSCYNKPTILSFQQRSYHSNRITNQQIEENLEEEEAEEFVQIPNTSVIPLTSGKGPLYSHLKVGDLLENQTWKLMKINDLKDYSLTSYLLKNTKTDTYYLHLDAPHDTNNSFAITFQTPPSNNSGIPHILEHTTLCGSEKFPVRDLFFNMMKRSLNTYMNAYTANDHTTYPFATINENDFYNLMNVYLDATFFPRILKNDFNQEGWRLEYDNENSEKTVDSNESKLKIKGVVYNEMKGAMSDSSSYFGMLLQKNLLPNTIYEFNSGGDPDDIPKLTYEELKNYHKKYYTPNKSKIYTYGNLNFLKHLKYLNEFVFNKFNENLNLPNMENERVEKWNKPKIVVEYGPPDSFGNNETMMSDIPDDNENNKNGNKNIKLAIGYLLTKKEDTYESFVMNFICNLLLDEPRGIFYKNLIASGIAPDFSPSSGYDSSTGDSIFSVGVQNISEEQIEQVITIIRNTFLEVYKNGISSDLIETILHSIELSIKKKTPNFGVNCCYSIFSNWIHQNDPILSFKLNDYLFYLKKNLQNKNYFKKFIKKYFLENSHELTLVVKPDNLFFVKKKNLENEYLLNLEKKLTNLEKLNLVKEAEENEKLKIEQSKNIECLPTLELKDISRKILDPQIVKCVNVTNVTQNVTKVDNPVTNILKSVDVTDKKEIYKNQMDNVTFYLNPIQGTNGIVQITTLVPIPIKEIPQHLLPYISLFGNLITKIGTDQYNHLDLAHQIELFTGGIDASVVILPNLSSCESFQFAFKFQSFCLERNTTKMIQLFQEIYTNVNFLKNLNYVMTCIDQITLDVMNGMLSNGHYYARTHASSNLLCYDYFVNCNNGIDALKFIMKQSNSFNNGNIGDNEEIGRNLQELAKLLLRRENMKILITCEEEVLQKVENEMLNNFYNAIPSNNTTIQDFNLQNNIKELNEHLGFKLNINKHSYFTLPSSIGFLGKATITTPFITKDSALLKVLSTCLNSNYLHQEIREKGGAYGSNVIQGMNGMFTFSSYRDPNPYHSLNICNNVMNWINNNNEVLSEKMLQEAKLQVFQQLDAPVTPHFHAQSLMIYGINDELRQFRRNIILDATREELQQVCYKYFDKENEKSAVTILGGDFNSDIPKEDQERWSVESLDN